VARAIVVALNGVYQQINTDFITKGHSIVFKTPPTGTLDISSITNNNHNRTSYPCTGIQTTFHLPAFPNSKFEVIPHTSKDWVPEGYVVVDVNVEIETWIRDNNPPSDWKWADPLNGTTILPGSFGMMRMIIKESILTYIATRWA
jgi:hypothetical protein